MNTLSGIFGVLIVWITLWSLIFALWIVYKIISHGMSKKR